MQLHTRRGGYSLIELTILVVILGIVCYFIFLSHDSFLEAPEELESVAAELVRIGIHNYAIYSRNLDRKPVFPRELDEAEDGTLASAETPLFTHVYPEGIRTGWKKVAQHQYVYLPSTGGRVLPGAIYHYDPDRGTFLKGKSPGRTQMARNAEGAPRQRVLEALG